ncbi:MAG: RdgB/HAM1 family non-canonical purine NTP pyrophosphatase [Coriobacteriia bacterium]|nr:RdgB/HAM1 family non-canonical purine NTP pyrophosphatase [Coriobacteriia bacterium]
MDAGVRRIAVATSNTGKLAEIRTALAVPGWRFVSVSELGLWPEVPETGESFFANALIKAEAARERFGLAALADDSGLEVDALGGAPGVRSSRYAGEPSSDARNNEKLLAELADVPEERRTARFRSVVVLLDEDGTMHLGEGTCEGRIASEPRGEGGFGYDPIFLPDDAPGRTMAELGMEEKNAVSHRGAALRALREGLAPFR